MPKDSTFNYRRGLAHLAACLSLGYCSLGAHAGYIFFKNADRNDNGEWTVSCEASLPGWASIYWDNDVYHARLAAGEDPERPIVQFATAVTQLEPRAIEGTVFGRTCVMPAGGERSCEPATEEYPMRLTVFAESEDPQHVDIWVQQWTDIYVDAAGNTTGGTFRALLGDWPDALLSANTVFLWQRGGTTRSLAPEVDLWYGPTEGRTVPSGNLGRRLQSCVSSHLRGGRVMAPEARRLVPSISIGDSSPYARGGW